MLWTAFENISTVWFLVKVPQIVKIWRAKSGAGVSVPGQFLELMAITGTMGYSIANKFPFRYSLSIYFVAQSDNFLLFSAWGEALFMAIQTAMITILIWHYSGRSLEAAAFLIGYLALCFLLIGSFLPMSVLALCQASNIPIIVSARVIRFITSVWEQSNK